MKKNKLLIIFIAIFCTSLGYGISFPLLSLTLQKMGASATIIGLNASMPALGWLISLPFLPYLQRKFGLVKLFIFCLSTAILATIGFYTLNSIAAWFALRLLFGGCLGFFFLLFEYWLNSTTTKHNRGKIIGIYGVVFLLGLILGSLIQSNFASNTNTSFYLIAILLATSAFILMSQTNSFSIVNATKRKLSFSIIFIVPIAMFGVFVYALMEDLASYLMSIYALKIGHSEELATLTLAIISSGVLLLAVPVGMISDVINRTKVITFLAVSALILTVLLIQYSQNSTYFLILLFLWGGSFGSIYNVSLSIIGDKFSQNGLAAANATYGMIYAVGSLVGPSLNGIAMDVYDPNGALYVTFIILMLLLFICLFSQFKKKASPNV